MFRLFKLLHVCVAGPAPEGQLCGAQAGTGEGGDVGWSSGTARHVPLVCSVQVPVRPAQSVTAGQARGLTIQTRGIKSSRLSQNVKSGVK